MELMRLALANRNNIKCSEKRRISILYLIKCDISPRDRQNFASYPQFSSEIVLNLLTKDETAKGTYIYFYHYYGCLT